MTFVSRQSIFVILLGAGLATACQAPPNEPAAAAQDNEKYADAMLKQHEGESPVANAMSRPAPGAGEVDARMVDYGSGGSTTLSGYLAMPADFDSTLPSVIVIHEWWGLNDNVKAMTEKLAAEGYLALAVDLYNGSTADDAEGARALMQKSTANMGAIKTNLRTAYNYLARTAGAEKIATLGWCFGGGMSLQTALLLPRQVDATVIYYGHLETDPAKLEALQMPILGIFGAEDSGIPVATVREFEAALKTLGKDAEIHVYDGADHAFANPSGERYNAEAAEDAWRKTLAFLDRHLKN